MKQSLPSHLARVIVGHPWPVVAILLVTTVCAGILATRMTFDFAPQSIFAGNDELLQQNERVNKLFGADDTSLLVVLEATGATDVLHPVALEWQTAVVRDLQARPDIKEVQSLADAQEQQVEFGWPPSVHKVPVIDPGEQITAASSVRMRRFVERSGLVEGALVSEDRRAAAVSIAFKTTIDDLDSMREMVAAARCVLDEHPAPAGYRVHLTGLPVMRSDIVNNLQADQALLIPVAGLIYLVTLVFLFRRVSGSLVPLLAVGIGLAWTLAVLVLMGESFNLISNVLPMLLLILGVSNSVHVVSRYAEESENVQDRRLATRRTLKHMCTACLLTFGTEAVGFLSLWTTRSDALSNFGTQAAFGLGLLYLSVMLTLGVLLPLFRAPRHMESDSRRESWPAAAARRITAASINSPRLVFGGSVLLIIGALIAGWHVPVNSYTIETYDRDHPTIRTMQLVEDKLGGLLPLEIALTAENSGALIDADVMRRVADVERFALQQTGTKSARSYVDLHRELDERAGGATDPQELWPPAGEDGRHRVERSARFMARAGDAMESDRFITKEGRQARVLLRVQDIGTAKTLELIERLQARLNELFPAGGAVTASLTGEAYVNATVVDSIIRNLFGSLAAASLVILAIIAILFRSLRVGMIAAVPNMLPLLVTLGYMGLRGFDMNVGNVIVFTISLGMAIDDTIHLLIRFRDEYKSQACEDDEARLLREAGLVESYESRRILEAVRGALRGTGRPIFLTTVLIMCGLTVLLLSDFVPTRHFAELTIVTMTGALWGNLVLLPSMIVLFWKRRTPRPQEGGPLVPPHRARRRVPRRLREITRRAREVVSAVLVIPRRSPLGEASQP